MPKEVSKVRIVKKSKVSMVLMSALFVPTLVLGNVNQVNACAAWNPFCKGPQGPLEIPPLPPRKPTPPSVQPYPRLRSEYYTNDNIVWDILPQPHISDKFTVEERSLIWLSLQKLQEVLKTTAFVECVNSNVTERFIFSDNNNNKIIGGIRLNRIITGNGNVAKKIIARTLQSGGRPSLLFIDKVQLDKDLGQASVPKKIGSNYDYIIELNSNKFPKYTSPTLWAGVIAHEILHSYGYSHPDIVDNDFAPIAGNFVYETGYCVNGEGSRTMFLDGGSQLFVD
jgi:hypothetical protein